KVPAPHNEKQTTTIASFRIRFTNELRFVDWVSLRILRQTAEISKAINAGPVAIAPVELQRITAHDVEFEKVKALVGVAYMWAHDSTEHIRLTAARSAGTCAPQQFEFQKRFSAIIPRNGQFISNLLDVVGLQTHLTIHLFFRGLTRTKDGRKNDYSLIR